MKMQSIVGRLTRYGCFVVFSTVGMGAIGLGLLAGPLAGYFADREIINTQGRNITRLQKLYDQQEELLGNLDNPSIIKRAAINTLNYEPGKEDNAERSPLPVSWPDLKRALAKIEETDRPASPGHIQLAAENLAENRTYQIILLVSGGALVVLSLTFFHRRG